MTVGPKQSVLIDLPVTAAPNLGLTFIAQPGVSVSLLNEQGVLVSRDPGDSPFANVMFRTVLTKRPVTGSVWKLKIENTTEAEQAFAGFSWSMADLPVPPTGVRSASQSRERKATGFFAAYSICCHVR